MSILLIHSDCECSRDSDHVCNVSGVSCFSPRVQVRLHRVFFVIILGISRSAVVLYQSWSGTFASFRCLFESILNPGRRLGLLGARTNVSATTKTPVTSKPLSFGCLLLFCSPSLLKASKSHMYLKTRWDTRAFSSYGVDSVMYVGHRLRLLNRFEIHLIMGIGLYEVKPTEQVEETVKALSRCGWEWLG